MKVTFTAPLFALVLQCGCSAIPDSEEWEFDRSVTLLNRMPAEFMSGWPGLSSPGGVAAGSLSCGLNDCGLTQAKNTGRQVRKEHEQP